ncbi:hypothetical protein [Fibrella aquatilis]|uniref:hypothetical protein n=1 Tax=Fibrella aquatilis TaxID=2817059 RepID=UPI001E637CC0|nr:hypothetical protein [Fibrella aquatilis]
MTTATTPSDQHVLAQLRANEPTGFTFLYRLLTALFFQRKSIDTAGYANRHTAQNQKYKCLEQARRHGRDLLRQHDD